MNNNFRNLMDTKYVPTFVDESKYERIHHEMAQNMTAFCEQLFEQADTSQEAEQETTQPILYCLSAEAVRAMRDSPVSSTVVPLEEKILLTVEEAAAYTGLGLNTIRKISNGEKCSFVLWNGTKRMLKRAELVKYLNKSYSI